MGGSGVWNAAWAKAPRPVDDGAPLWSSLATHLDDAARIAGRLWDEWVGSGLHRLVEKDVGNSARTVALAAAALHDIGKLTRAFSAQEPSMRAHMEKAGFGYLSRASPADARVLPHSLAGHVIVRDWLVQQGVPERHAAAFATIVGSHHGTFPSMAVVQEAGRRRSLFGDDEWDTARHELLARVVADHGLAGLVDTLREHRLSDATQVALAGFVIAADWIASNSDLFPLSPAFAAPRAAGPVRAELAWHDLALPAAWAPTDECLTASATELLRARFPHASAFAARPVQELAVQAARTMAEPGLLLIEASMGTGKTEASLLAAEVMARRWGYSGVFYGLPTRATTDAMFHRVLQWWSTVPDRHGDATRSVGLRHSSAGLNDEFRGLPRGATPGRDGAAFFVGPPSDVGRDEVEQVRHRRDTALDVVVHQWTSGRKRGALADCVVATIDHELMAALVARHVQLRHLGLLRQVVVLDEIHAADTWMRVYLERSLEWLGRYGVPVIALSATLPPDQRAALVHAYERGRRAGLPEVAEPLPAVPATHEYPVVTALAAGQVSQVSQVSLVASEVDVEWLPDDLEVLTGRLSAELAEGGCALVVCNTVTRARTRYVALRERFGDRVSLTHSRFIARDRASKDADLVHAFGPGPGGARDGRIVVSTQVAEQSLDIDFDLLISDLAPVDVLLQRVGRLHRHDRPRPGGLARARLIVTGADVGVRPQVDGGSMKVYGGHLLLRTAALLRELVEAGRPIRLPADVPLLVDRCYGDEPLGPAAWVDEMAAARQEAVDLAAETARNAGSFALAAPSPRGSVLGWRLRSVGDATDGTQGAAQVREPDGGFEVVLLERAEDGLALPAHLGDARALRTDMPPSPAMSRALAGCLVRVPGWVTTRPSDAAAIFDDLNVNYFPAWQKDPVMGGQVILVLDADGNGHLGRFPVSYDPTLGLEVLYA